MLVPLVSCARFWGAKSSLQALFSRVAANFIDIIRMAYKQSQKGKEEQIEDSRM
jgi:hypothetical protein